MDASLRQQYAQPQPAESQPRPLHTLPTFRVRLDEVQQDGDAEHWQLTAHSLDGGDSSRGAQHCLPSSSLAPPLPATLTGIPCSSTQPSGGSLCSGMGLLQEPGRPECDATQQLPPWYCQWSFWVPAASAFFGAATCFAAVLSLTVTPSWLLLRIALWRWGFLLSALPAVYWLPVWLVWLLLRLVELRLFTATRTTMYFVAVGTKKAFQLALRAGLLTAVYGGLLLTQPNVGPTVQAALLISLKLLGCATLCAVAQLLQKLVGKLMAAHFHKGRILAKMQDALKKEYYLAALCQPLDRTDMTASTPGTPSGSGSEEPNRPERRSLSLAAGLLSRVKSLRKLRTFSFHVRAGSRNFDWGYERAAVAGAGGAEVLLDGSQASDAEPPIPEDADLEIAQSRNNSHTLHSSQPSAASGHAPSLKMTTNPTFSSGSRSDVAAALGLGPAADPAAAAAQLALLLAPLGEGGGAGRQGQGQGRGGPLDVETVERMHKLERHIRNRRLRSITARQAAAASLGHCPLEYCSSGSEGPALEGVQGPGELAFHLFQNVKVSRKRAYWVPADLERFLPAGQARDCFAYFDRSGAGKCTLADLRAGVAAIFEEREHLAQTLRDSKAVIGNLQRLLGACFHILFVFAYLALWQVNVMQAWLTFSSVILAFSFVCANSIRVVYECVVFIFVVHPFDVGEVLVIQGQHHKVEEMALLTTTLLRSDGARLCWPNTKLAAEPLLNLSRSDCRREVLRLTVEGPRPPDLLHRLAAAAAAHVRRRPSEFAGSGAAAGARGGDCTASGTGGAHGGSSGGSGGSAGGAVSISVSEAQGRVLGISVHYQLAHNGVDVERCCAARTGLVLALSQVLADSGVTHSLAVAAGDSGRGAAGGEGKEGEEGAAALLGAAEFT